MEKILIIDDDVELCELLTRYLAREGFDLHCVHDGALGVTQALGGEEFALLVLDVMLPSLSGFEVLRRVRAASTVPVLMLTARGEETDRIVGLEIGADDYLPKPFNPRELSARIRAILRRIQLAAQVATVPAGETKPQFLRSGDLEIEIGARLARQKGAIVDLTGAEFDLLLMLLENAGVIVTKQELVRAVLGRELSPYDRSIDTLISNLRRKLGHNIDGMPGVERIKAVRGNGYLYAATRSLLADSQQGQAA